MLRRPRRNRRTAAIRELLRETTLSARDLILPVFVKADGAPEEIPSMPGVFRRSIADTVSAARAAADLGILGVALFPKIDPAHKDPEGSHAFSADNLLFTAIRALKSALPELIVVTDVALDPYTSHGHDGLVDASTGRVLNDPTVEQLCRLAVMEAEAGADWVAPSDMMDGRVRAIRLALDQAGAQDTAVLSYAAKFASAYYGPFREAVGSSQAAGTHALDKRSYQLDPANAREALLEARLDEEEGADLLMVKPAGSYLDIIRQVRDATLLPVAAYQVSGEYAQIHAAARAGWLDLAAARDESLLAIKRAGADIILTYFAADIAASLGRS